jgi:hypothetical protein
VPTNTSSWFSRSFGSSNPEPPIMPIFIFQDNSFG